MKNKLFVIPMIAAALALGGCSKFLDEKSQSDVIPRTTTDFRELLLGSGYPTKDEPAAFLFFMDDDASLFLEFAGGPGSGQTIVGTDAAKEPYLFYTWQPRLMEENGLGDRIGDQPTSTPYYAIYERIKGCNAVLDYIDDAIGTEQDRSRVKAEALAIRAFHYFRLVNLYGDPYHENPGGPAVPLKLNSSVEATPLTRNTVAEVYDAVLKDLQEAARLMDPLPIVRKDFHINQPAIHILLSRVYLHMEKWKEAVEEADKVFELGGRVTNLTSITAGKWINYDNADIEWMYGSTYLTNTGAYIPAFQFISTFSDQDVRKIYGFLVQQPSNTPLLDKFTNNAPTEITQAVRTTEALMNRAEANAQLNNLGDALKALNDLRRYRIIGYTDVSITDKATLLQEIRDERRREFCYEGFRWFDLRRYGRPAIVHRYQYDVVENILEFTLAAKDPMYTLPFPTGLLLRNPALTQNPSANIPERAGQ
jgi:tetratricopeptide (TPR) repeat protein